MLPHKPKTALFFGSFDPVHVGHLIIGEYFLNVNNIEQVWFVITPQNPFKAGAELTGEKARKEMLELAIEGVEGFKTCDVEFNLPPPHYTHNTLQVLMEMYPEREFVLLIGGDNLHSFHKWKNWEQILEMVPVYVYPRQGFSSQGYDQYPGVIKTNAPIVEISSSGIRKNLAEGLSARFLLPSKVYDYIVENKLYKPNASFT
jgi:nicotinate-nucleotide adenylyltransferase